MICTISTRNPPTRFGVGRGDLLHTMRHPLELDRRDVRAPPGPLGIGRWGRNLGERRELIPRQRTVVRSGCDRRERLERPRDADLGLRARRRRRGIGHDAQCLTVVEHPRGRQPLEPDPLLLHRQIGHVAPQRRGGAAPQGIDPRSEVERLGRFRLLDCWGERTFDHTHEDDDTEGV